MPKSREQYWRETEAAWRKRCEALEARIKLLEAAMKEVAEELASDGDHRNALVLTDALEKK